MALPKALLFLASHFKKLPGVGSRTAERFAFELLTWSKEELIVFGDLLKEIKDLLSSCAICGCLTEQKQCPFCNDTRETFQLCLISSPRDAFAIEATKSYHGLYHVIEHLLSPLDGRHAATLR